jgi:APA family basic amino acid/polyamine antiporter
MYNDLLDYAIFAVLTIGGLFRLRRTSPNTAAPAGVRCAVVTTDRPYRAVGYPILPALYMLVAGVIEILLLLDKPAFTVRGWKKEGVS